MSWDQYSQTPATNYVSPYAFTGMAPSLVKVAVSNVMADLAQFQSLPTSGGTANAQTVTNTRQFAALFTGMRQSFIPSATNTGAMTLAVDGLAAKNVFGVGAAAIAGMVTLNVPAHVQYDGTQWQLINPQRSTGSSTGTFTGFATANPTATMPYSIAPDGSTANIELNSPTSTTNASNATTMTITGLAAVLTPARNQALLLRVVDSGTSSTGTLFFSSGGTLTFRLGLSNTSSITGGFTASGSKSCLEFNWKYDRI